MKSRSFFGATFGVHRQRRLRHAQADGGLLHVAFFGDRNEIAETAEVHSRHTDPLPYRYRMGRLSLGIGPEVNVGVIFASNSILGTLPP